MKRILALGLVLVMAMGFLGACGGSKPENGSQSGTSQTGGNTGQSDNGTAQTLTFAVLDDPDSLDPNWSLNSFSGPLLHNAFVGLMRYDLDGMLVNGLAKDYTVSDDGMQYVFTLEEGLKWSDGSDLTAYDFEYSWNRILDPEFASRAANSIYIYIKNGEAIYNQEMDMSESGVKALDATTLQVDMEVPCPYFLELCASWTLYPVCKEVVENNPDWTKSADTYVSNGPFKLLEYKMGDGFYLERNPYYYKNEDVKLETLTFKIMQDLTTALTAYLNGELDGLLRVPSTEIPNMRSRDDFYSMPSYSNTYWLYNTTNPTLADPLVRKALALALDRDALIDNVLQADYEPAGGYCPPGYTQSNGEDFRQAGGNFDILPNAQIEQAKKLLAEAGYEDLSTFPKLRLGYYTNDTAKKIAEALQQMWKQNLGIEMEIVSAEWAVYYDQVIQLDYDICAMGDSGSVLHPMTFLMTFEGDHPPLETGWRNAEYDEILNEIRKETNEEKAEALMHKAEDIFMNDYPILPLYYGSVPMMMADYVENWNYTPTGVMVFDQIEILPHE